MFPTHQPSASLAATGRAEGSAHQQSQGYAALAAALAGERPIGYNVNVARICGDVKAALFLSQLIYWTRVGSRIEEHGGWIFKTREEAALETGLSRYEQESARNRLLSLGLIQEARVGVPARNCYRVVPEALGCALAALMRTQAVQWTLFDLRSNADPIRALLGRNLAFYRVFTEVTESLTSAVYLSKALAIQKHVSSAQADRQRGAAKPTLLDSIPWEQDWFSLSVRQFQDETGLTTAQQRDCKQKLCQKSIIEEAFQTHPRRMSYLRVNVSLLSELLQQCLLNKIQSKSAMGGGLLGAIVRGLNAQTGGRSNRPTVVAYDSRTDCPTSPQDVRSVVRYDSAQELRTQESPHRQLLPTDSIDGTTNRRTVTPCDTPSICRTVVEYDTPSICRTTPPVPSVGVDSSLSSTSADTLQKPPTRFPLSSNPVGGFSHIRRGLLAAHSAGNSSTLRLDLAALHARAVKGITSKTTTTNTGRAVVDAKSSQLKPVVVVCENQPTAKELVWPEQLKDQKLKASALNMLCAHVNPERHQLLLDEVAGKISGGKVNSPLAYLGTLARLEAKSPDGIVLEVAHEVQAKREAQQAHQARMAAINEGTPVRNEARLSQSVTATTRATAPVALSAVAKAELAKLAALRSGHPSTFKPDAKSSQLNATTQKFSTPRDMKEEDPHGNP